MGGFVVKNASHVHACIHVRVCGLAIRLCCLDGCVHSRWRLYTESVSASTKLPPPVYSQRMSDMHPPVVVVVAFLLALAHSLPLSTQQLDNVIARGATSAAAVLSPPGAGVGFDMSVALSWGVEKVGVLGDLCFGCVGVGDVRAGEGERDRWMCCQQLQGALCRLPRGWCREFGKEAAFRRLLAAECTAKKAWRQLSGMRLWLSSLAACTHTLSVHIACKQAMMNSIATVTHNMAMACSQALRCYSCQPRHQPNTTNPTLRDSLFLLPVCVHCFLFVLPVCALHFSFALTHTLQHSPTLPHTQVVGSLGSLALLEGLVDKTLIDLFQQVFSALELAGSTFDTPWLRLGVAVAIAVAVRQAVVGYKAAHPQKLQRQLSPAASLSDVLAEQAAAAVLSAAGLSPSSSSSSSSSKQQPKQQQQQKMERQRTLPLPSANATHNSSTSDSSSSNTSSSSVLSGIVSAAVKSPRSVVPRVVGPAAVAGSTMLLLGQVKRANKIKKQVAAVVSEVGRGQWSPAALMVVIEAAALVHSYSEMASGVATLLHLGA